MATKHPDRGPPFVVGVFDIKTNKKPRHWWYQVGLIWNHSIIEQKMRKEKASALHIGIWSRQLWSGGHNNHCPFMVFDWRAQLTWKAKFARTLNKKLQIKPIFTPPKLLDVLGLVVHSFSYTFTSFSRFVANTVYLRKEKSMKKVVSSKMFSFHRQSLWKTPQNTILSQAHFSTKVGAGFSREIDFFLRWIYCPEGLTSK